MNPNPYRHTEIVHVEECASCRIKNRRREKYMAKFKAALLPLAIGVPCFTTFYTMFFLFLRVYGEKSATAVFPFMGMIIAFIATVVFTVGEVTDA